MKIRTFLLSMTIFALAAGLAYADCGMCGAGTKAEGHEHKAAATEQGLVKVNNAICPVSGQKVGEMGEAFHVSYQGKVYNLCCAMCKKDFLEDPEKYSAIAEESAQKMKQEKETEGADRR